MRYVCSQHCPPDRMFGGFFELADRNLKLKSNTPAKPIALNQSELVKAGLRFSCQVRNVPLRRLVRPRGCSNKSPELPSNCLGSRLLNESGFRNVFTNVRHTVKGLALKQEQYAKKLVVEWMAFSRDLDNDPTEMIRLNVTCEGRPFDRKAFEKRSAQVKGTFNEHRLALEKFAAKLDLQPMSAHGSGSIAILEIIRRNPRQTNQRN